MIFVRDPEDDELHELKHMTRHAIGRVSQRAQMVLLSAQGRSVPEIAPIFAIHPASVRFWLRRFNLQGPQGLQDAPRSGRPRLIDSALTHTLAQLLLLDPMHQAGAHPTTIWTVALLTLALMLRCGHTLSRSTVRAAMHRLGLRWGRPRLSMPPKTDPDKIQKQWRIAQAVISAPPDTVLLYADESRVQTLSTLRAMWHWVGQQVRIPTPGSNTARAVFGALAIHTGQWTYLVRERMRADDYIAFWDHLLQVYPDRPIILIVDNYSSHRASSVKQWLATHPQFQMLTLPTYCSHLNPVERIWLRLKNQVAANRLYGSIKEVLITVASFFEAMTPEQARVWAAEEK